MARIAGAGGERARQRIFRSLPLLSLVLPLAYAPLAISGYYGTPRDWRFRGLDGLTFLGRPGEGDRGAADWLLAHAAGRPVVLEAWGESYSECGRISMATGLPTVLGWRFHEVLWRGGDPEIERRAAAIRSVYEQPLSAAASRVIEEHRVRFIVLGATERRRFTVDEPGVRSLGVVVYENGGTLVIALP